MSADRLAIGIHDAAQRAAQRGRSHYKGRIVSLDPFSVECFDFAGTIDEDEGLTLTQWVRYYDATTGLEVDDVVHLIRHGDAWSVVDVESDKPLELP